MTAITAEQKADIKKAKEHILRSKLYKAMACVLALAGLVITVMLYEKLGQGKPMHIIQNPVLIAVLLLPFVPAFFMAMLSKKKRATATKILSPLYPELGAQELDVLGEN